MIVQAEQIRYASPVVNIEQVAVARAYLDWAIERHPKDGAHPIEIAMKILEATLAAHKAAMYAWGFTDSRLCEAQKYHPPLIVPKVAE